MIKYVLLYFVVLFVCSAICKIYLIVLKQPETTICGAF